EALNKTTGQTQVGIINSLGIRREKQAAPTLTKLLAGTDPAVGAAAARALGEIGGVDSLKALRAAATGAVGSVKDAIADANLRCAEQLLARGDRAKALVTFRQLYETEKENAVRVAAYRGMIRASGRRALALVTKAIAGESGPSQVAALQSVPELQVRGLTRALAGLLPKVDPTVQATLIEGLSQRGDLSAASAIAALRRSGDPAVRLAALKALGHLGDASMVADLAEVAASAKAEEQEAARRSLTELRGRNVTRTMLNELAKASPAAQAELARALGERRERTAVPELLVLAQKDQDATRKAALQALARLADQPQLAAMVQLVVEAQSEDARAASAEALNAACQQIQTRRGRVETAALVNGMGTGSAEACMALAPVCSGLVDAKVRQALRLAAGDPNSRVRAAALRAMCDTRDAELLPDLLRVACGSQDVPQGGIRSLAIGACVRLTTQEESVKLSNPERLETLRTILASSLDPAQKRLVLAGLGELPDPHALKLVEPLLDDTNIQNEAAQAAIKIAPALPGSEAQTAEATLRKALVAATDAATRRAAEAALKQVEANADFITAWEVAGPYRQAGKDYAALFDIPFPPEMDATHEVKWRTLPPGSDLRRPWLMDLLKALGGEQCVAYARTWVHSEQPQPARLEIGSDDGVKVWLNRQLVHQNNVARGLTPAADKVNVTLKSGWNPLLLKITQNNQGWEFCARFVQPDGSRLKGLKFDIVPRP
ncbi:MAG: hypothetical protein DME25_15410, partial [Verrucomicrobia bacterium]